MSYDNIFLIKVWIVLWPSFVMICALLYKCIQFIFVFFFHAVFEYRTGCFPIIFSENKNICWDFILVFHFILQIEVQIIRFTGEAKENCISNWDKVRCCFCGGYLVEWILCCGLKSSSNLWAVSVFFMLWIFRDLNAYIYWRDSFNN